MRNFFIFISSVFFLLVTACNSPYIPKQKGYANFKFPEKTLCDLENLWDAFLGFNKCKGGDLVSRKVLERGVGTALEVTC